MRISLTDWELPRYNVRGKDIPYEYPQPTLSDLLVRVSANDRYSIVHRVSRTFPELEPKGNKVKEITV
jgi:hypothetical protein